MPENERILIVDDREDYASLLGHILSRNDYPDSTWASSGTDGLRLAREGAFDIILLDLEMPGMDGFETCRLLKADPTTADIPVIFVSGRDDTESIVRAFSLGGADYISRPFKAPEILARIELHLSLRKMRAGLEENSERLEQEIEEHKKTEDRLRQSEANMRSLIENAPVGILTINRRGQVLEVNPMILKILGSPSAEATRAINVLTFPPLIEAGIVDDLRLCLDHGRTIAAERSYTSAWGRSLFLRMHFTPIHSAAGAIIGAQIIAEDVSDTLEARAALEASEMKFRTFIEHSPDTVIILSDDGIIHYLNVDETGGATGKSAYEFIAPADHDRYRRALAATIRTGESRQIEVHDTYDRVWLSSMVGIEFDGESRVMVVARDITARKQAERDIEEANTSLSARVYELGTLNTLMQTIGDTEDLDTVLGTVAETMTHFLDAGACMVGLFNKDQTSLKILKNFIPRKRELPLHVFDFPVNDYPAARAIVETEQPLIVQDAWNNPISSMAGKLLKRFNLHTFLVLPLKARGKVIGALTLGDHRKDRDFSEQDISLAETIAGQLAGAMENTRLLDLEKQTNRRLRQANRQIVRDLKLAREIQYGLLPAPRPSWDELDVVCYTVPARSVGGDFYEYHKYSADLFGLAVGDISGKGTAASLLMATCLSRLDASFSLEMTPADRLAYLDKEITKYTKPRGQFCALCYAEIRADQTGDTRTLEMVTAGAFPPMIKRGDGRIETPRIGGLPLGIGLLDQVPYRSIELQLNRGDMVILASDGLVDTMNPAGDLLGFDRLDRILEDGPSSDAISMLEHLKAEALAFAGKVEQQDDLTIIVARV